MTSTACPRSPATRSLKRKLKTYPIGYFEIDIAEVHTAEGKLTLFVAIDRTSKFAFGELPEQAGKMIAAQFLRNLVAAAPYTIHTVRTDDGIQFTNRACDKYAFHHIFDCACDPNGIQHRLTKVKHPWTNGQVERMNRTITIAMTSFSSISATSLPHIISDEGSRPSKASRLTRPSARHGKTSPLGLHQTRTIKCRHQTTSVLSDQTGSPRCASSRFRGDDGGSN
jgi:Integrase core domain